MEVLEESLPLIMYKVTEMLRGFQGKEKTKLLFIVASLKQRPRYSTFIALTIVLVKMSFVSSRTQ